MKSLILAASLALCSFGGTIGTLPMGIAGGIKGEYTGPTNTGPVVTDAFMLDQTWTFTQTNTGRWLLTNIGIEATGSDVYVPNQNVPEGFTNNTMTVEFSPESYDIAEARWISGGIEVLVRTPRRPNEDRGAWARRHRRNVQANLEVWPPDQPDEQQ